MSAGVRHDSGNGEVCARLAIDVGLARTTQPRRVLEWNETILRYGPCTGCVGGSAAPYPVLVDSAVYGRTQASASRISRLFVDDARRTLTDVGRTVKQRLFPTYPGFVFNTVGSIGAHDANGAGSYVDPASIWFNLLGGYYQIDAACSAWSRPFGYRSADGVNSEVCFEDLVRLAKADWNWFSNWMYGVPTRYVAQFDGVDLSGLTTSQAHAGMIGSSAWHLVSMRGLELVSAYESDRPGAASLVNNSALSRWWRRGFGLPRPRPDWPESFIGTVRDGHVYMAFREDDAGYHTVMFGGSVSPDADAGLLTVQLDACRAVIERQYPALGFELS